MSEPVSKEPEAGASSVKNTTSDATTLTYVEFYCGVGGWTMALEEAVKRISDSSPPKLERLAALDHSDLCLGVLQHNFPSPTSAAAISNHAKNNNNKKRRRTATEKTVAIERLTLDQVHAWHADIWMMSPPCQPHTRQHGKQKVDVDDPRSESFLHLLTLLRTMKDELLPQLILLENVVGFEASGSCLQMRQVLEQRQYHTTHLHLTPTQVGIPNDRPRYFCVAVRRGSSSADDAWSKLMTLEQADKPLTIRTHLQELGVAPLSEAVNLPAISTFLDTPSNDDKKMNLAIPEKLLNSQAAWCFDTVTPVDTRSTACFTSAYGRFVRGTGSVLYEGPPSQLPSLKSPQDRQFDASWADGLDLQKYLRYFSGSEMARLMGFAPQFHFPTTITVKQQWKLVGNSLNVRVAGRLCELGLRVIMRNKNTRK
jgi:tRNA (cytosine38-C5)-methyltransferase